VPFRILFVFVRLWFGRAIDVNGRFLPQAVARKTETLNRHLRHVHGGRRTGLADAHLFFGRLL